MKRERGREGGGGGGGGKGGGERLAEDELSECWYYSPRRIGRGLLMDSSYKGCQNRDLHKVI